MRTDRLFRRLWAPVLALGLVLTGPSASRAQGTEPVVVYRREVFEYDRAGRPDPFRSLVSNVELGVRLDDLSLRGVMYHPDPSRSVAVLVRAGEPRPLRVRVGQRVGGVRVIAIRPRSIDVVVDELGVARRATLEVKRPAAPSESAPEKGGTE